MSGKPQDDRVQIAKDWHEQTILVLGFLGGVAFTALVLVLQEEMVIETKPLWFGINPVAYFSFLMFWLGMVSAICVIAAFATQRIVANLVHVQTGAATFAYYRHYVAGFLMFLASLPMILFPFAPQAAIVVLVAGSIIGVIAVALPKRPKEQGSSESKT